jgi:hypothetical protein
MLGLCLTLAVSDARADEGPKAARFEVTVVHASPKEAPSDPSLGKLATYLTKSFKRYKSFKKLKVIKLASARNKGARGKLPGGKALTLTYLKTEGGFVHVKLELDGLNTTIRVRDGGLFFHAGRRYEDGILVLAIQADTQ